VQNVMMQDVTPYLLVLALLPGTVGAQDAPKIVNPAGFVTIDWVFADMRRDLYDVWAESGDNGKLKGPVARYLDWPHVSSIIVLYNGWHLLAAKKDMRIQHIEENLGKAAFGERFKGKNPGGAYILLLRYKDSERNVVVAFKDGLFLVEGVEGIGVVDVRGGPGEKRESARASATSLPTAAATR
jgi:hypothetical protein